MPCSPAPRAATREREKGRGRRCHCLLSSVSITCLALHIDSQNREFCPLCSLCLCTKLYLLSVWFAGSWWDNLNRNPRVLHHFKSLSGLGPWILVTWTCWLLWVSPVVLVVKNPPFNAGDHKRCQFDPWFRKIPWRRAWQPTLVFMHRESHGQRTLAGYSPGVTQSRTWLSNLACLLSSFQVSFRVCTYLKASDKSRLQPVSQVWPFQHWDRWTGTKSLDLCLTPAKLGRPGASVSSLSCTYKMVTYYSPPYGRVRVKWHKLCESTS